MPWNYQKTVVAVAQTSHCFTLTPPGENPSLFFDCIFMSSKMFTSNFQGVINKLHRVVRPSFFEPAAQFNNILSIIPLRHPGVLSRGTVPVFRDVVVSAGRDK
jgi:hypothetical protein